jgi:hypothetical protein
MARVARVTCFEREVRERLSSSMVEILMARAQVLSEGRRAHSPSSGSAFFGSTMMTIDLVNCADVVRERCDPALTRRLATLMASDARVIRRAQAIAEREANRLAGIALRTRASDVRVRAQGVLIYVDVDVEGPPEDEPQPKPQRAPERTEEP